LIGPLTLFFPPNSIGIQHTWRYVNQGFQCLAGAEIAGNNCGNAFQLLSIQTVTNFLLTVFVILVLRSTSATVFFIVSTVRLPLINLAFTQTWIMGSQAQKSLGAFNYIGLVVIVGGLLMFYFGPATWDKMQREKK